MINTVAGKYIISWPFFLDSITKIIKIFNFDGSGDEKYEEDFFKVEAMSIYVSYISCERDFARVALIIIKDKYMP